MASKEVKDARFLLATTQAAAKQAKIAARKLARDEASKAIKRAKRKVTAMIKRAKAKARMVEQAELRGHNKTSSVLAVAKNMYKQTYAKALRGVQSALQEAKKAEQRELSTIKGADHLVQALKQKV